TRLQGDWSSDVCSSDLARVAETTLTKERAEKVLQQELKKKTELLQAKDLAFKELETNLSARFRDLESQVNAKESSLKEHNAELRSEERRVGKECRARGW